MRVIDSHREASTEGVCLLPEVAGSHYQGTVEAWMAQLVGFPTRSELVLAGRGFED